MFLLKKNQTIKQGEDKENKGWESGMVSYFFINIEANYFLLQGFSTACYTFYCSFKGDVNETPL